jgi:hypothetical protein
MQYIIENRDSFLKNKSSMISNNKMYFSKSLDSLYMFAFYSILFLRVSLLLLLGFTTYVIVFISDTFPVLNIHVIIDKCYYYAIFYNNADNVIDSDSKTEDKKTKDVVKYYNKWSQMEWTDDDIESICVSKNNFVIEQTSLGNIIMHYNLDDEAFHYYSDVNIPCITLDIVCRKYVVTYHCPWLYIHRCDEIEKIKQDAENDDNNDNNETDNITENIIIEKEEQPKKSNMAKFKKYNNKKKVSIDDNLDIKCNKYIHKGKIMDCKLLATTKPVTHKEISFSDFKKNM